MTELAANMPNTIQCADPRGCRTVLQEILSLRHLLPRGNGQRGFSAAKWELRNLMLRMRSSRAHLRSLFCLSISGRGWAM